jgi:hypothetical protein
MSGLARRSARAPARNVHLGDMGFTFPGRSARKSGNSGAKVRAAREMSM